MIEQRKKLRLDELKVDSFVTSTSTDLQTIQGGQNRATGGGWWCIALNVSLALCPSKACLVQSDLCEAPVSVGGETYCC